MVTHFGELSGEQRALAQGIGVAELDDFHVVEITGVDRHKILQLLSSQEIIDLVPGTSTETLFLDVNGRIEHAAAVLEGPESTFLITETAEGLAAFLLSMRFMMQLEVIVRDDLAVLGTRQDGPALPDENGTTLKWEDPWPHVSPTSTAYGPNSQHFHAPDWHPGYGWQAALWLVPTTEVSVVVASAVAAGAKRVGTWAWEALRIETWRPRWSTEVDERTIAHEVDWLRTAVHLEKGCYKGQETVARVFNIGKPPRRLIFVHLDGSDHVIPDPGAPVMADGKQIGVLTSVARHFEQGPIGLALIRRSVDPSAELDVGGIAGAQEIIVNPDGEGTGRPAPIDRSGFREVRQPGAGRSTDRRL